MEYLFVVLLTLQCIILLLHDTMNFYPLNDIRALRRKMPTRARIGMVIGNALPAGIALLLESRWFGHPKPLATGLYFVLYYAVTLAMMYMSWYHLYLFGASEERKRAYREEYGNTLQILPPRGDNPRPNALHVFLHLLFIVNTFLAVMIGFNLV